MKNSFLNANESEWLTKCYKEKWPEKNDEWDQRQCQCLEDKYTSWQLAANKFTLGSDLIWVIDGQCASEGLWAPLESVTDIAGLVIIVREGETDNEPEGGFVFS